MIEVGECDDAVSADRGGEPRGVGRPARVCRHPRCRGQPREIPEVDVRAVAALGTNDDAHRAAQFLEAKGLLVPRPTRDADQAGVERLVAALPGCLVPEVEIWIRVLRGDGRRPSRVTEWATIRRYLSYMSPVLHQWGARTDSLRAITTADIRAALAARGPAAHSLQSALRSLFRALKRERAVFQDPARSISLARPEKLPEPLSSDRLRGLLDRAPSAAAKVAVALVAIHALRSGEIRAVTLTDLDRAAGRLTVRRRRGRDHTAVLDELTLTLITAWLRERAQRWPTSTNPHLLVTQITAVDSHQPAISKYGIWQMFRPLGISPAQLRIDRLLDEAHHTADPIHLRVFGICDTTAMKYLHAAHPERFTDDPTRP